jgi:hypothetical protein
MLAHAVNGDIGTQACKPFGKGSARPRPAPVTSATLPCSVRAASYVGMMSSPDVKGQSAAGSRRIASALRRSQGRIRLNRLCNLAGLRA